MAYRNAPQDPTAPSTLLRMLWTLFFGSLAAAFMIAGYTSHIVVAEVFGVALGFYGVFVLFHLLQQILFAQLNTRAVEKRRAYARRTNYTSKVRYSIQSVGWRENAEILAQQFRSIKAQTLPWERFIFVSDGHRVGKKHTNPKLVKAFENYYVTPVRSNVVEPGRFGKIVRSVLRIPDTILDKLLNWIIQPLMELIISIITLRFFKAIPRILGDLFSGRMFKRAQQQVRAARVDDDSYMAEIFLEQFPDGHVLWIDFLISEARLNTQLARKELWLFDYIASLPKGSAVFIMQPKAGKREAMYTAARLHVGRRRVQDARQPGGWKPLVDMVLLTDSDTELDPRAAEELVYMHCPMPGEKRRTGAATGDVLIYNVENFLSLMSSLRYWFAFNLERAAQSYFGSVTCVSGPLGMYNSLTLDQILPLWINQEFLGQPTTFGDDRSLTNLTLSKGWAVRFTHRAKCSTDTPVSIAIWRRQQERWNKSYLRELLINLGHLYRHHPWLTYDMIYQAFFPIFLILSMGNLAGTAIRTGEWIYVALWVVGILIGGFVRAFYAIWKTWNTPDGRFAGPRRWIFMVFIGYGFLYVSILLITRIKAYITVSVNDWGTPERSNKVYGAGSSGSGGKTLSP